MRVLVYPHSLVIGGSQRVAIDLAAGVRDRGHDVIVFAPPGPLAPLIEQKGLRLVVRRGPDHRRKHVSLGVCAQLWRLMREERIDLVHAYEASPSIEAFYGAHLLGGSAMVATILSPDPLRRPVPRSVPLVVGRPATRSRVGATRRGRVDLVEPPLPVDDVDVDPSSFVAAHRLEQSVPTVLVVSRMDSDKLETIATAIAAVAAISRERSVRLLVVGDGSARVRIERAAHTLNSRAGLPVVVLTGELLDPRPAYSIADVVVGEATALEWGMAFGKPAIVLGNRGFCRPFDSSSSRYFREHGPFGDGPGEPCVQTLQREIMLLLDDPGLARRNGDLARQAVAHRNVPETAKALERVYEAALRSRTTLFRRGVDGAATAARLAAAKARRPLRRSARHHPPNGRDDVGHVAVGEEGAQRQ